MHNEEYKKLVKKLTPKENKFKNMVLAFLTGGLIGFMGELFVNYLNNIYGISFHDSYIWLCITIIFMGVLLTSLGFFDRWFSKCRCGLIIPTTGFAHAVASCALDYKRDGLITGVGSNFFKLAGSVIIYGVISSFFLALLKVIIYG